MDFTKLNQLKKHLSSDIDGIWLSNPENIYYFTGFLSNPHERLLSLLITEDALTLFLPKMEVSAAKKVFDGTIIGYLDTENAYKLTDIHLKTIMVEEDHLTVKRLNELKDNFGITQIKSIDQEIKDIRNIKSEEEINILKQAAAFADEAIEIGVHALKEGVTELEIVREIERHMLSIDGIASMSFDTMVLFGDNAALPHGVPGDRKLKNNEFVLFDLGVVYKGYCSDITRTIAFGTPIEQVQKIYDTVLEANLRAIKTVRPGVKISDCDKAARDYITEQGYGEYFPHRLGHGLGISVHEFPDISSTNHDTFKEGMVFTIESGVYVEGVAGVRIEDDIVVTKDGYEIITGYEK